ncbi:MAG: heavy-metal-associated domain-containing protein [Planctomycetes bacterium]|nr:heavy-metal-associated domain-containing protein [Planctomycetota bacterium]
MSHQRNFRLFLFFLFTITLAVSQTHAASGTKTKLKKAPNETVIYVGSLHCKTCAKKITRKLYAVKGVTKVRIDLKANLAIVTPQKKKKLDPLALWTAAQASGFPAIKLVGPTGTYLPHPETKAAQKQPNPEPANKG